MDTGITMYSTVPVAELLPLVNVCTIDVPDPSATPVIVPDVVSPAQLNVLDTVAVRGIFTVPPLQIVSVLALVTAGVGLTVTV